MLALWRPDRQPVELGRDLDLAGEPRVGLELLGEVEHGLFHVRFGVELAEPGLVDIDVAGRARARPAAIGVDAGDEVLDRAFHDAPAGGHFDLVLFAVVLDVFDLRHGCSAFRQTMFFMGMEVSARRSRATAVPSAISLRPTRYSGAALTASTAATLPPRRWKTANLRVPGSPRCTIASSGLASPAI